MPKNHTKTLVFTTLDILQLKKLMILKIFTVRILSIYLLIMRVHISKEKMKINTWSDSTDEKKELLKTYTDVWDGIKNEIKTINDGKENDDEKNYMNIKCNSDDDLPLNKPLKFHSTTITFRSVFEEDGKLYPQVFLDDTLYELNV